MTAQNGKDLLIKVDLDGAGNFQTLAGLRATRLSFNTETVDTTNALSSGQWRELLSGGGVKTASVSGSGVFLDDTTDERARQVFFDASTPDFQVIIPDFGIVEGAFQISSIEYSGQFDGEALYEMSLQSAGELQFLAI